MKTIEERANEFALKIMPYSPFVEEYAQMYIDIAKEQKALDDKECETMVCVAVREARQVFVNKACEWLKAHYKDIYWEVESPTRRGDIAEYLAENFRKAMEEEI